MDDRDAVDPDAFADLLADVRELSARVELLEQASLPVPSTRKLGLLDRLAVLRGMVRRHGGFGAVASKAAGVVRREGLAGLSQRLMVENLAGQQTGVFTDDRHDSASYINEVIPRRRATLGSDWHRGLIRSRTAAPDRAALPPLAISAVTYNSERWIPGFLDSLLRQDYPLGLIELIVADNGSGDGTVALLREFERDHGPQLRSVRFLRRENDGFGAGHNAAIDQTQQDLVLVTNVDLIFDHDSLVRSVMAALADAPEVACWELAQKPHEHPKYYDPVTLETPWCAHACVLLRRQAFAQAGGFDDHIFMYGEDVELSYRLRGMGYLLRYLPWARVTHFVDVGDTTARPRQLGGSLAAAVLLRYRYSTREAAEAAERQLTQLARHETDPVRRAGFAEALSTIRREREHFTRNRRPEHDTIFPFFGFDYVLRRDGHDVPFPVLAANAPLPRVSVITRTYGPETGLLAEAICTVLNQTYPDIEHVIVEDRGEHARELVEATARDYDRNLRFVASPGSGRSPAGNAGMADATGEILILLDNDDLLFADHVASVVAPMIDKPALAAAYSLAWEVQVAGTAENYTEELHELHPQTRLRFSRARLRHMNFIPIQAIAFRKSLFDRAGGFDEDLHALEDWALWNKYAHIGKFEMVPRLTSIYHTPQDPSVRARRQAVLDEAYEPVKARIAEKYR